ncbi:unnamed protein product [Caenorhabditis bovis]|uniref:Nuclear Hormone Receptor family n=1 Tax=Caenorhabditis bovis TaxID=2654633 RepID=A0A8S1F2B5_9PELO|nr:unnamed protein product [Caenorhabditis bovis]
MEPSSSNSCSVCSRPSSGNHFGAETCRACAAFFRWMCRKCRLNRCYDVGMLEKRVQYDRDLLSTAIKTGKMEINKITTSLKQFVGRSPILLLFDPQLASPNKTIIDISPMLDKLRNILSQNLPVNPYLQNKNLLQRVVYIFEKNNCPSRLQVVAKMTKSGILERMERDILKAAQCAMESHVLDSFSVPIRIKLINNFWHLWAELGKIFLTMQVRGGGQVLNDKIFLINDAEAIDLNNTEWDITWSTKYPNELIDLYYRYLQTDTVQKVFDLLQKIKPTLEESLFITCVACLSYRGRKESYELSEYTDSLIDALTDCLHDYYSNTLKLTNYSHRLSQLLQFEAIIKEHTTFRRRQFDLSDTFDVFSVEYSHSDIFDLRF